MYGTAFKLGKMLMHIKWIVLAKENTFLLSRPVALYMILESLESTFKFTFLIPKSVQLYVKG